MNNSKIRIFLIYILFGVIITFSPTVALELNENHHSNISKEQHLSARGVVEAIDRATISSGISSRIKSIGFRRGQRFSKGDVLVEFSCNTERARNEAAKAAYVASRQNHEKNKELLSFEATGRFDVEISKAEMDQSLANYNEQRAILSMCVVKAPYNGTIVSTYINTHETPQASQPLIEIVNTEKMEVTLIVPSSSLSWLTEKDEFTFNVEDTGEALPAYIDRIGAVVDSVSQTVEIIAVIENPGPNLRPGMGGEGKFVSQAGG